MRLFNRMRQQKLLSLTLLLVTLTMLHEDANVARTTSRRHPTDAAEYRAKAVGLDPETDLAVLKIDPKSELVPFTMGNPEAVQGGDWPVAFGSPFGLEASVTAG